LRLCWNVEWQGWHGTFYITLQYSYGIGMGMGGNWVRPKSQPTSSFLSALEIEKSNGKKERRKDKEKKRARQKQGAKYLER